MSTLRRAWEKERQRVGRGEWTHKSGVGVMEGMVEGSECGESCGVWRGGNAGRGAGAS